jgi:hypothetical protein
MENGQFQQTFYKVTAAKKVQKDPIAKINSVGRWSQVVKRLSFFYVPPTFSTAKFSKS